MRKYLKKYKKEITIIAIITLFVIPLCIHVLFKMQAPISFLVAEWSAGDILAFYGVLVGAAATVAGVYISIHASQENYHEDVRNRSLPYITVTPRFIQTRNFLEKYEDDEKTLSAYKPEFKEYSLEKVYYVISDGNVSIRKELSDEQESLLKYGGYSRTINDYGGMIVQPAGLMYLAFEVENVGNGAAVNFSIGINNKTLSQDSHIFSVERALKIGEKYYIAIYCEKPSKSCGEYIMCISYFDIFRNHYQQTFTYTITAEGNGKFTGHFRMDGLQKRL